MNSPDRWQHVTAPEPGFTHEGFVLPLADDGPDLVTVAVATGTGADRMAVFLRTRRSQLPCYVLWRMIREGLFAFGLEPCNSPFGTTTELLEQGWPLMLDPGEQRRYELEFGVVTGASRHRRTRRRHHSRRRRVNTTSRKDPQPS